MINHDPFQCQDPYATGCSWPAFKPQDALVNGQCANGLNLFFTPPEAQTIVTLANNSGVVPFLSSMSFGTEDDMVAYAMSLQGSVFCYVGVVFTNVRNI